MISPDKNSINRPAISITSGQPNYIHFSGACGALGIDCEEQALIDGGYLAVSLPAPLFVILQVREFRGMFQGYLQDLLLQVFVVGVEEGGLFPTTEPTVLYLKTRSAKTFKAMYTTQGRIDHDLTTVYTARPRPYSVKDNTYFELVFERAETLGPGNRPEMLESIAIFKDSIILLTDSRVDAMTEPPMDLRPSIVALSWEVRELRVLVGEMKRLLRDKPSDCAAHPDQHLLGDWDTEPFTVSTNTHLIP